MSLTDTINNTNTQKENIKTVATQIDNKLVELGGERATNLADVTNKMEGMVTENYKKVASGSTENLFSKTTANALFTIPLNLSFVPERIFCSIKSQSQYGPARVYDGILDSSIKKEVGSCSDSGLKGAIIKSIAKEKMEIQINFKTAEGFFIDFNWIAIE